MSKKNEAWTARDQLRQMICEEIDFDYTKIFEEVEFEGDVFADLSNEGADALADLFTRFFEILQESHGDLLNPIDMILHCPKCRTQHIDAPEPEVCVCGHRKKIHGCDAIDYDHECSHDGVCAAECPCTGFTIAWDNPPHKSHLCRRCKTVWRPADVPTNGVAEIKTRGFQGFRYTEELW